MFLDNPKVRRVLILIHLYLAAILAPAFLLVAFSGLFYMNDTITRAEPVPISLPAGTTLDTGSQTLTADVQKILSSAGVNAKISGAEFNGRARAVMTQPTNRKYYELKVGADGTVSAASISPTLKQSTLEVHKSHGPAILKTYHKFMAIGLMIVTFGGILVGLMAKAYRRKTIFATVLGFVIYIGLFMFGT